MRSRKVLLGWLCITGLVYAGAVYATIDGDAKAKSQQAIVFNNRTAADTLETIRVNGLHGNITFTIKITGITVADTCYAVLEGSLDDSTYVNLDDNGDTQTFTSNGTWSMSYDLLSAWKFIHIAYPRMADSLTVKTKAFISVKE
jgi:hypothetical protein